LNVQAAHLILSYGGESWPVFRDGLKEADTTGDYTRVWRLWDFSFQWLERGVQLSFGVLNSILFAALCGFPDPVQREESRDDAPSRLNSILEYLADRRQVPADENVMSLLDDWARERELPTVCEALDLSARANRLFVNQLLAEMQSLESTLSGPLFAGTRELFEAWCASREYMAKQVAADPLGYLDPVRYLNNLENFVACPQYLSTTSGIFNRDGEVTVRMREIGWSPVFGRRSADGVLAAHQFLRAPGMSAGSVFLTRKQSWDLSSTLWLSHLLWSHDMLGPLEREIASLALRDHLPDTKVIWI
jgi:hypothetical protein